MISIKTDHRALEKALRELTPKLNKSAQESMIQMARTGCKQAAYRTQPWGTGAKAKDIAVKAIHKDANKAYLNFGRTYHALKKLNTKYAAAYAHAVNSGDYTQAEKIVRRAIPRVSEIKSSDNGSHLESQRSRSTGRVPNSATTIGITNSDALAGIVKKKTLSAGLVKGGFLAAGNSLPGKLSIPRWLKKDTSTGTSSIKGERWGTKITIINHVRHASSAIKKKDRDAAVHYAYVNHVKGLQRAVDALSKKV